VKAPALPAADPGLASPRRRHVTLILACAVVSAGCLAAALWSVTSYQRELLRQQAMHHAEASAAVLNELRGLYASEVVARAKAHGMVATHDYAAHADAIPLPATLALMIGRRLAERGVRIRLYSPYPFPWRKDGGLRDDFDRAAWAAVVRVPGRPFYRFVGDADGASLRYAIADRLRAACVDCHNQHPDSPRRGWKVGDVRGVLEVDVPLASGARSAWLGGRLMLLILGTAAALAALALILSRTTAAFRRVAEERRRTMASLTDEVDRRARAENELRRADQELRRTVAQLAHSNRELDDFAYVASHDLKEPLRGIQSFSRFLVEDEGDKLSDEGRTRLDTMQRLTERMQRLIDDLLQLSRLGRVELARAEVELDEVVRGVVTSLEPRLDELGVEVRIPRPWPRLVCDQVRVDLLVRNLVTNAMKYNDKAEKWIELGWRDEPGRPPVLYVRDNGIGIADKHREVVFKMFKRLHARDAYGGGTGAGLAFARRIVELHGGRIWVESERGVGSTFSFTLAAE